jgi:hypothetical protein
MEDDIEVFPTEFRDKHSKAVSYPLGAKAISSALAGVPQAPAIRLWFMAGGHQQTLHQKERILVLSVIYSKRARRFSDGEDAEARGVLDSKWRIHVHAVPAAWRHSVHLLLKVALLDEARPWLLETVQHEGRIGEMAIRFDYDKSEDRLISSHGSNLQPPRS